MNKNQRRPFESDYGALEICQTIILNSYETFKTHFIHIYMNADVFYKYKMLIIINLLGCLFTVYLHVLMLFKGIVHPKIIVFSCLSFQTCMSFVLLHNPNCDFEE